MSENSIEISSRLERLAEHIHRDIDRRAKSRDDWIEATINLCINLNNARAEFRDNIGFGKWFDASGFRLSHQDRAAAIAMGEKANLARQVIEKTESRSIRLIRHEFDRLTSDGKTTDAKTRSHAKGPSAQRKKAAEVYDELKAAGVEPTVARLVEESGFSRIVVEPVIAAKKAVEEAAAPQKEFPPEIVYQAVLDSLSPPMRAKLEAGRRAYAKQLSDQFDDAVSKKNRDWSDQIGITMMNKRLDAIEEMFTWPRNSVMRKSEYNIIMRCLHPDTAHSRSDSERAEGFRLFTKYKLKMIDDEEERITARRELRSQMPKTLAELLARRAGSRK